jgi:hypothetical protein
VERVDRRDNLWKSVTVAGLAPVDNVKLSLGAVVAADVNLIEGEILLDQSRESRGNEKAFFLYTTGKTPIPKVGNLWFDR